MSRLPLLSAVKNSIEILKKEKWPTFEEFKDIEGFKEYYHSKFAKHFNNSMIYLKTPMRDLTYKFYRVRPLEEIGDLTSIGEYSYPPKEHCKKNRANLPGYPVFYCSTKPSIALLETIRNNHLENKDRQLCLTQWVIKTKRPLTVSPFIHNIEQEDYKILSEKILTEKITDALRNSPYENDSESFRAIMEYLSSCFVTDDERSYSISSFIGHSHIYMPHEFKTDLFMYPSIQSSMKDINFAINPNTVDECLMLKYLLILQVTDLDLENNLIRVDTTHYGISDGSKIDIRLSGTFSHGLDPVYLEILEEFNRIEE